MTQSTLKKPNADTRLRILEAAMRCVNQWGIDKTNLNDIAKEAGVTRPTVYSYFSSREEVVQTALLESGYAFAERLKQHIQKHNSPQQRLVEAVMFALKEMPKEPYLHVISQGNINNMVNESALTSEEGQAICLDLFLSILNGEAREDLAEIIEITTRTLLSLLLIEGPIKRSEKEKRIFLEKRLLPALEL